MLILLLFLQGAFGVGACISYSWRREYGNIQFWYPFCMFMMGFCMAGVFWEASR